MTTLLLVRHGNTESVGKRLVGRRPDLPLDATGRAQVARLGDFLAASPLTAVYSSPLLRARQTAEAIARPHGLGVTTRDALVDLEFGAFSDRSIAELVPTPEFRRFNLHRAGNAPPGGEHVALVQARMVVELCALRDAHADAMIAVVAHADPLRAALAFFLGIAVDLARRLELEPASITRLELWPEDASVRFVNREAAGTPVR